jgi:hypothetical protein
MARTARPPSSVYYTGLEAWKHRVARKFDFAVPRRKFLPQVLSYFVSADQPSLKEWHRVGMSVDDPL